ncbi:MAG: hypothetical protein J6C13_03260 [Clostridia bacterium]|nr:hypothetical protein [Clostridia bacterium]
MNSVAVLCSLEKLNLNETKTRLLQLYFDFVTENELEYQTLTENQDLE